MPHTNCIFIKIVNTDVLFTGKTGGRKIRKQIKGFKPSQLAFIVIYMDDHIIFGGAHINPRFGWFQVHSWMCSRTQVSIFTFCSVQGRKGRTDQEQNLVSCQVVFIQLCPDFVCPLPFCQFIHLVGWEEGGRKADQWQTQAQSGSRRLSRTSWRPASSRASSRSQSSRYLPADYVMVRLWLEDFQSIGLSNTKNGLQMLVKFLVTFVSSWTNSRELPINSWEEKKGEPMQRSWINFKRSKYMSCKF